MHKLTEIVYDLADRTALRVRPRLSGVSLVPVDSPGSTAADFARATRATLSRRGRQTTAKVVPGVHITLESAHGTLLVVDDRVKGRRAINILPAGGTQLVIEADTSSLVDDSRLQAVLAHIAVAFDIELVEDLGPGLATITRATSTKDATPKELAVLRAHDKLRTQALEIQRLHTAERTPTFPMVPTIGVLLTGLLIMVAAGLLMPGSRRSWAMPLISVLILSSLGVLGWRAWRKSGPVMDLETALVQVSQARETAREELSELSDTLARRGADPDEVIGRFSAGPLPAGLPTIISMETFTSVDMQRLADLGRPVIVFVDRRGLLFAEDYGEALVPL